MEGKQSHRSPPQRCYWCMDECGWVRVWLTGGIDPDDSEALDEIVRTACTVDAFNLLDVHLQAVGDDDSAVIVHYSDGQQRLHFSKQDNSTTTTPFILSLMKARKQVQEAAQQSTTQAIITARTRAHSFALLSPSQQSGIAVAVRFCWPGKRASQSALMGVEMMPGWRDTRVVSKRCVCLRIGTVLVARLSAISLVFGINQAGEQNDLMIVIEGKGKWLLNDRLACPVIDRLFLQVQDREECLAVIKGLREAFELIVKPANLPISVEELPFTAITIHPQPSQSSTNNKLHLHQSILQGLVYARPWSSLAWPRLYAAYQHACQAQSLKSLSPLGFTRMVKGCGYCLRDEEGLIVPMEGISEESDPQTWYWYHLALQEPN